MSFFDFFWNSLTQAGTRTQEAIITPPITSPYYGIKPTISPVVAPTSAITGTPKVAYTAPRQPDIFTTIGSQYELFQTELSKQIPTLESISQYGKEFASRYPSIARPIQELTYGGAQAIRKYVPESVGAPIAQFSVGGYEAIQQKPLDAAVVLASMIPVGFAASKLGQAVPLLSKGLTTGKIGSRINLMNLAGVGLGAVYGKDVYERVTADVESGNFTDTLIRTEKLKSEKIKSVEKGNTAVDTFLDTYLETYKRTPIMRKPTVPEMAKRFGGITYGEILPMGAGGAAGSKLASIRSLNEIIPTGTQKFLKSTAAELLPSKKTPQQKLIETEKLLKEEEDFLKKYYTPSKKPLTLTEEIAKEEAFLKEYYNPHKIKVTEIKKIMRGRSPSEEEGDLTKKLDIAVGRSGSIKSLSKILAPFQKMTGKKTPYPKQIESFKQYQKGKEVSKKEYREPFVLVEAKKPIQKKPPSEGAKPGEKEIKTASGLVLLQKMETLQKVQPKIRVELVAPKPEKEIVTTKAKPISEAQKVKPSEVLSKSIVKTKQTPKLLYDYETIFKQIVKEQLKTATRIAERETTRQTERQKEQIKIIPITKTITPVTDIQIIREIIKPIEIQKTRVKQEYKETQKTKTILETRIAPPSLKHLMPILRPPQKEQKEKPKRKGHKPYTWRIRNQIATLEELMG